MSRLVVSIGHVEFTGTSETLYVITVQQDADEWEVRRSYSEFRRLRDEALRVMKDERRFILEDQCSYEFTQALKVLPFPGKKLFGAHKDKVVKARAMELHNFLIKMLMLTHTYRKAQKVLHDQQMHQDPRVQASVGVFYALRDFLKPATSILVNADDLSSKQHHEQSMNRMIRESKMLAMRNNSPHPQHHRLDHVSEEPAAQPGQPTHELPMAVPAGTVAQHTSAQRSMSQHSSSQNSHEQVIGNSRSRRVSSGQSLSRSNSRATEDQQPSQQLQTAAVATPAATPARSKTINMASLMKTVSERKHSTAEPPKPELVTSSSASSIPAPIALQRKTSKSDPALKSLRVVASSSSEESRSGKIAPTRQVKPRADAGQSPAPQKRRPRKKHSSSTKSSESQEVDRKTRLSPQLAAQSISIDAQKELERYLTEYSAIMILRYVDRFISKATTKAPGCYQVTDRRLVIDSERFLEELEDIFTDLPANFSENFQVQATGEWVFPKALDAYVQMKWNAFQESLAVSRRGGARYSVDDDSDDSDYEYEDAGGGGGYMKSKKQFTQEEEDVLQEMIANGTAGKDQVLRLRRQLSEQGWNRRENPGAVTLNPKVQNDDERVEYWSDTEEDENRGTESTSVKRYQEKHNARRKDRLSNSFGGLV